MITTEKINKIPDGQIQIKGINALKNAQKRNNNKAVENHGSACLKSQDLGVQICGIHRDKLD